MKGLTFDAGGLIALDRGDRGILLLLARAAERDERVTVPATALAQALRDPKRQARLSRFVREPTTDVVPLGAADARTVGMLLAATRTADVVDAHVVVCARRAGRTPIVTSDPDDLRRLDPQAILVTV